MQDCCSLVGFGDDAARAHHSAAMTVRSRSFPPLLSDEEEFQLKVGRRLVLWRMDEGLTHRGKGQPGRCHRFARWTGLVFRSAQPVLSCSLRYYRSCSRKTRSLCISWFMEDFLFLDQHLNLIISRSLNHKACKSQLFILSVWLKKILYFKNILWSLLAYYCPF